MCGAVWGAVWGGSVFGRWRQGWLGLGLGLGLGSGFGFGSLSGSRVPRRTDATRRSLLESVVSCR